jgi:serine protease AprX
METLGRTRFLRIAGAMALVIALGPFPSTPLSASGVGLAKLDPLLQSRVSLFGRSRVIARTNGVSTVAQIVGLLPLVGGHVLRTLSIVDGVAIDLPNLSLPLLAGNPLVGHISMDRVVAGAMERTGATVGATAVRQELGLDGGGVGVAVIDSGVTPWHDDLADSAGAQRIDRFVDFVGGRTAAYDDYGHGTHVSGIVAGNGYDSDGRRTGIAPGSHLVVLKVLDGSGVGRISDVIAAMQYVQSNKSALGIRIVNLSVATGVSESYNDDPLTLAARNLVAAGVVVVAAAGNNGRSPSGTPQYGGITAPGNAPWVLTVGASSHMGTADRSDDTMAAFSSRGPAAIDFTAKPDLVAPGVGIESLSNPASRFYSTHAAALLPGTRPTSYLPYMSLSGTSMASPVVAGTVALMLQANPSLTPNAVKAILQYTAQPYAGYDPLTQGAGFLNAKGAVELAAYLAAPAGVPYPDTAGWSERIIWGNQHVAAGPFDASASAWSSGVTWGAPLTPNGQPITLSTTSFNVVWGLLCGGHDCPGPWSVGTIGPTSTGEGDTVVWGTSGGTEADTVVWGTSSTEGDTVVWGTSCTDPSCSTVVWGSQ